MLEIILAYRAGFDKIFQALGVCSSQAGGFFGVLGGVCVRGRHKGQMGSSMVSFKVTRKMKKKAPPDSYELTEEEREAIIARNLSNPKISEETKRKYQNKKIW